MECVKEEKCVCEYCVKIDKENVELQEAAENHECDNEFELGVVTGVILLIVVFLGFAALFGWRPFERGYNAVVMETVEIEWLSSENGEPLTTITLYKGTNVFVGGCLGDNARIERIEIVGNKMRFDYLGRFNVDKKKLAGSFCN